MKNTYLASKPRYEILDGLRGVAAVMVVLFHIFECYSPGVTEQIINHGYLSVDFFFALSGFVIAYAYDDRWNQMNLWTFFKRRITRLHPMAVFGTLLCACFFYMNASSTYSLIETTPWYVFLLMLVWCCTIIPVPPTLDIRGWGCTNPINDPIWTLQLEYIANILYALVLRRISKTALGICSLIAGFFTITLTMNIDLFGFLATREETAYTVIGGWTLTAPQVFIGFVRLAYPFLMGLLVARIGRFIQIKNGFVWCSLVIIAMTAMPRIGGSTHLWMNGLYETVIILLLFPLILSIGAGSEIKHEGLKKLCIFLGEISYPLYITHFAYVYMLWNFKDHHPDAPLGTVICLCIGLFIASIWTAYAAMKLYDLPIRRWLQNRWFR